MWLTFRHNLAAWIFHSGYHKFMVDRPFAFTACETLHFMGLTVLFGALMIVDLRGLGFFKRIPLLEAHKLVPFAIGAFVVQLLTGVSFIFSNPNAYFYDVSFGLKMILVVLAGLNALAYEIFVHRPMLKGDTAIETAPITKITSLLSLLFWSGVLIFGRLIPYL